jgi:hypothetical protein
MMFQANTKLKTVFITSFILTALVTIALQYSGGYLVTNEAPFGIVSFEFSGDMLKAQKIIDSWGIQGMIYAGLNLGLDYLFLIAYSLMLASCSLLITEKLKGKLELMQVTGYTIAIGSLLAGFLDAIENVALISILVGNGSDFWAQLALLCAIPKFILAGLAIAYVVFGGIYLMIVKKSLTMP